jgi:hypothetical protein
VLQHVGNEVITQAGQAAAPWIVAAFDKVAFALQIEQEDVQMRATTGSVGVGFGHETGKFSVAWLEGLAFTPKVTGVPRSIGPPRQDSAGLRIRAGRELFVADIL